MTPSPVGRCVRHRPADSVPAQQPRSSHTDRIHTHSHALTPTYTQTPHTLPLHTHTHKLLTHSTHTHPHTLLTHPQTHTQSSHMPHNHTRTLHTPHTLLTPKHTPHSPTHTHTHLHTHSHTHTPHPHTHTLAHSSHTISSHILPHRHTQGPHTLHIYTHTPSLYVCINVIAIWVCHHSPSNYS